MTFPFGASPFGMKHRIREKYVSPYWMHFGNNVAPWTTIAYAARINKYLSSSDWTVNIENCVARQRNFSTIGRGKITRRRCQFLHRISSHHQRKRFGEKVCARGYMVVGLTRRLRVGRLNEKWNEEYLKNPLTPPWRVNQKKQKNHAPRPGTICHSPLLTRTIAHTPIPLYKSSQCVNPPFVGNNQHWSSDLQNLTRWSESRTKFSDISGRAHFFNDWCTSAW